MKSISNILILVCFVLLSACASKQKPTFREWITKKEKVLKASSLLYQRDSDYISKCTFYRVKYYESGNNDDSTDGDGNYKYFRTDKVLSVFVDTILYNSDSTKLFAIYTINYLNADNNESVYYGSGAIGVRNNKNRDIDLYPLIKFTTSNLGTPFDAVTILEEFYLDRMTSEYGCNATDKDFWTKHRFFQKVSNGKYYYQCVWHGYDDYEEVKYPKFEKEPK